jgi:hypothetical protein
MAGVAEQWVVCLGTQNMVIVASVAALSGIHGIGPIRILSKL